MVIITSFQTSFPCVRRAQSLFSTCFGSTLDYLNFHHQTGHRTRSGFSGFLPVSPTSLCPPSPILPRFSQRLFCLLFRGSHFFCLPNGGEHSVFISPRLACFIYHSTFRLPIQRTEGEAQGAPASPRCPPQAVDKITWRTHTTAHYSVTEESGRLSFVAA